MLLFFSDTVLPVAVSLVTMLPLPVSHVVLLPVALSPVCCLVACLQFPFLPVAIFLCHVVVVVLPFTGLSVVKSLIAIFGCHVCQAPVCEDYTCVKNLVNECSVFQ